MDLIRLELPLAPSANRIWRQGRGGRVYKSKDYTEWLEECGWMIKQQTRLSINGEYILQITAKRPDKRRRDLDNLLKATNDLLVKSGIIADDQFCRGLIAEWADIGPPMVVKVFELPDREKDWWIEIPPHMFRN